MNTHCQPSSFSGFFIQEVHIIMTTAKECGTQQIVQWYKKSWKCCKYFQSNATTSANEEKRMGKSEKSKMLETSTKPFCHYFVCWTWPVFLLKYDPIISHFAAQRKKRSLWLKIMIEPNWIIWYQEIKCFFIFKHSAAFFPTNLF